jgi:transcriptional regulator with XRE-family HTH domain
MTSLRALLANNIKKRRKILGISQAKLAEKVETSTHYIGQIEQQSKFPSPEMLERIATALEFDSTELFSLGKFPDEALKLFQEGVKAVFNAANISLDERIDELMKNRE